MSYCAIGGLVFKFGIHPSWVLQPNRRQAFCLYCCLPFHRTTSVWCHLTGGELVLQWQHGKLSSWLQEHTVILTRNRCFLFKTETSRKRKIWNYRISLFLGTAEALGCDIELGGWLGDYLVRLSFCQAISQQVPQIFSWNFACSGRPTPISTVDNRYSACRTCRYSMVWCWCRD